MTEQEKPPRQEEEIILIETVNRAKKLQQKLKTTSFGRKKNLNSWRSLKVRGTVSWLITKAVRSRSWKDNTRNESVDNGISQFTIQIGFGVGSNG